MRLKLIGALLLILVPFLGKGGADISRIVSLAPVATEYLFALGLGDRVVGVTTYCDRPAKAKNIAKIGGFADPQLEAIIKLRPDLVVATPFGGAQQVVSALKSRNIATVAQPVESIADMKRFLHELGAATNTVERAQKLQSELDANYAQFSKRLAAQAPRVLLLVSASPLIAAGPKTFAGEVLTHLGAKNAVTLNSPAWPVLSLEALMRSPPDVVVVTEGERAIEQARKVLAPLLSGQKTVRIVAPAKAFLQRPGPYLIEDVAALLTLLQRAQ